MFSFGKPILTGADWFVTKPGLEKSLEWQLGILAFMTALAIATVIYAFAIAKRTGRTDAVWICLGAALACYYEPLGDLMAHVTYHEVNSINFTAAFGHSIPLWVLPCYVVFFGAPIVALVSMIERGITAQKWMLFFFLSVPGAWLFEVPLLAMGATEYYGANQPFKLLNYPVWMAFSNTAGMILTATAVFYVGKTSLIRQHPILLAALLPLFIVGASATTILPVGSALSSSDSATVVNVFAIASILLSVLYAWITGKLLEAETVTAQKSVPNVATASI